MEIFKTAVIITVLLVGFVYSQGKALNFEKFGIKNAVTCELNFATSHKHDELSKLRQVTFVLKYYVCFGLSKP